MDHKKIRVLHHWPLSKVELVEIDKKRYILKTIHQDFSDEINKQKVLRKKCKKIDVPKVHFTSEGEGTVSFLMDYVPTRKKDIGFKRSLEMISIFHKETRRIDSKYFKTYNFDAFWEDYKSIRKYLGKDLGNKSKQELRLFFNVIFSSKKSVVHGDWGKDQIVGKDGKFHIVDFGKSFYGPSIIDYGHIIINKKRINKLIYKYASVDERTLIKARIIACIIVLSWKELCRTKYISYSYKNEIKESSMIIKGDFLRLQS